MARKPTTTESTAVVVTDADTPALPAMTEAAKLPLALKQQLHERLVASNFGWLAEHSEWLSEQGHSISKSAIHRYAQKNEAEIRSTVASGDAAAYKEYRMRCLEVAARLDQAASPSALARLADELLRWVYAN
jgi:hypothetical protein